MDLDRARSLVTDQIAETRALLTGERADLQDDHAAQRDTGDAADQAAPLAAQGVDDAVAAGLRDRLAALQRALDRIDDGTYGRSVRSGKPIPDARLEADPAAELTVEEAAAEQADDR